MHAPKPLWIVTTATLYAAMVGSAASGLALLLALAALLLTQP